MSLARMSALKTLDKTEYNPNLGATVWLGHLNVLSVLNWALVFITRAFLTTINT
jgi:hypothetical protein